MKILMILAFCLSSLQAYAVADKEFPYLSEMKPLFLKMNKMKSDSKLNVGVLAYLSTQEAVKHRPEFYKERMEVLEEKINKGGVLATVESDPELWDLHKREFKIAFDSRSDRTDDHILTSRSSYRVVRERLMNTCIDYVKAFLNLSNMWLPEYVSKSFEEMKVVYLFPKDLYDTKTCPVMGKAGNRRPFVHTALVVKTKGEWWVLNPEVYEGQDNFDTVYIGETLPERHSLFDLPSLNKAWAKYMPFAWGGTSSSHLYIEGFDGKYLGNFVISGKKDSDICQ